MSARGVIWIAGALALSAHAAVALVCWQVGARSEVSRPAATAWPAMQTRQLLRRPVQVTDAVDAAHAASMRTLPARPALFATANRLPEAAPAAAPDIPTSATTDTPPLAPEPDVAQAPPGDDAAPYYPRTELDVGPSPRTEVLIAFPASTNDAGRRSGRFRLFIDEQGVVQAVLPLDDEGTLTPAMVVSTRTAFLGTRFEPGHKDGQAVRARIDVEVNFDAMPLPPVTADNQAPVGPGA